MSPAPPVPEPPAWVRTRLDAVPAAEVLRAIAAIAVEAHTAGDDDLVALLKDSGWSGLYLYDRGRPDDGPAVAISIIWAIEEADRG